MTTRAIDQNHDWQYGHNQSDLKTGLAEVEQNIKTRIFSWKNDCFFSPDDFVDWDNILGRFDLNKAYLKEQIYSCVIGTEGVININNLDLQMDNKERAFYISLGILTIHGEIFIENLGV
jgi:hypothetical protein